MSAFREVKNALDDVYNDIASMSETVTDMTKRLENTKAQTKSLIDQTNSYQEERYLIDFAKINLIKQLYL